MEHREYASLLKDEDVVWGWRLEAAAVFGRGV